MNMSSRCSGITCTSLTKRFDGRAVVDDLSFEVPAGTITGFVGANGAGKTTTMRMILGLVAPSSGSALVNGRAYRTLEHPLREVGAVLDGPGAHPGHTATTHLGLVAIAADLPVARVAEVLDLVGLTDHGERRVGRFSLGMRQRLALAGALLGDPTTLILDEPVNGLDPPGILWMRELLRRLADDGRAVLVSSHLLGELAEVADRMVIIDRGRLVADAPLEELLAGRRTVELVCAHPALMVAALGERGAVVTTDGDALVIEGRSAREVGELAGLLDAGPVYRLTERAGDFEDAYFELAGTISGLPSSSTHERSAS
jgi:ABC-2 type transport system ATP-binding protein